jgi:triacylglycerol lipase
MAIELNTAHSHLQTGHTLALVSRAAYFDEPDEHLPEVGKLFPQRSTFKLGLNSCSVAWNEEHVVVSFRGKDDDKDWANALSYRQIDWHGGKVHAGFARTVDGMWRYLMASLFDADFTNKSLWFSGHSMGGALSMLAAWKMDMEGISAHALYTFGSPKVVNQMAADQMTIPHYRFVNNEDGVPHLSWPTFFDAYVHHGTQVHILPSGDIAEHRHSTRLARKIDRSNTIGEGILDGGLIHDHLLVNYIKKLSMHSTAQKETA